MSLSQISARFLYCLPLAFIICTASLFSQEMEAINNPAAINNDTITNSTIEQSEEIIYIIRNIHYIISGKTKETALEQMGGFRTGERFTGLAELESYISEKMRVLYNIRALESDKNTISYTLGDAETDGTIPVELTVSVSDSINFIIYPVPKYDSNYGLKLGFNLRDYNFMGNLAEFSLDLFWINDVKDQNSIGFEVEFSLPFQLFTYNWEFSLYNEFLWHFNDDPTHNTSILGISMELPVSNTAFIFGIEQGLAIREENTSKVFLFEPDAGEFHDYYLYTKPYILWYIPTPFQVGRYGHFTYTPGIYGIYNYQPGGDVGDYRKGPGAGINQELNLERIDWHGNFRQGIKISLNNDNEYNFFREEWMNSVGLEFQAHFLISRLFGISTRLQYTKWINDYYEEAGDVIRGYKDTELEATERLSLNLEFPFRLIRFVPSEWTANNTLRYLDFEQHWSLFVDLLIIDTIDAAYTFSLQNLIVAMGLEIITFPLRWRSFYLRASIGWNMNQWFEQGRPPDGKHREIYIGTGHYF